MTSKRIHENSVESFEALDKEGRDAAVLAVFRQAGRPLTDREVAQTITGDGRVERNFAAPSITTLTQRGLLIELDEKVVCKTTGKRVRACVPCTGTPIPLATLTRSFRVSIEMAKALVHIAECEGFKSTDAFVQNLFEKQCADHNLEIPK